MKSRHMPEPPIDGASVASLLMTKLCSLRTEMLSQQVHYRDHVRNFQLMSGGLLACAAYVLTHPDLLPSPRLWWGWWILTSMIPVVANYLVFDVLESQYAMILLGERLATIEEELNGLVGRRLFVWDSAVTPIFWKGFRPIPGVINPDWFMSIFLGMIVAFTNVSVPLGLYILLGRTGILTTAKVFALTVGVAFAIVSFGASVFGFFKVLMQTRGKPRALIKKLMANEAAKAVDKVT